MKSKYLVAIFSLLLLSSCVEELVETDNKRDTKQNETTVVTRSASKAYEKLPNPYALTVMQSVYDTYTQDTNLEPTDLYVRFMPTDSTQLRILYSDYNLELFGYPLDIELEPGDEYVDSSITENGNSWIYTTVKPDFVFPDNIRYEILEECYIPAEGESIDLTKGVYIDVEEEAFRILGYEIEEPETKLGKRPSGTIMVKDDYSGDFVPIVGVKVRCHRFIKYASAYTDENGRYAIDAKFIFNPNYSIVFENVKDFTIWQDKGPLAPTDYNMGKHTSQGWSADIVRNCDAWYWCCVNNAAYDYYKFCESSGINLPPVQLKIWAFKNTSASSAGMFRRVNTLLGPNGYNEMANFLAKFLLLPLNQFLPFIKILLPDITIGVAQNTRKYNDFYETVCHELSHASHYSKVGDSIWGDYINYIITYGTGLSAYGDGTGKNAELCAIGEMWGYSMGHRLQYSKYNKAMLDYPESPAGGWIYPHVFWDLIRYNILSPKQIFDCLNEEVRTYDALFTEMYRLYPAKESQIMAAFNRYGIYPKISSLTTYVKDEVISNTKTYSNKHIVVENVSVTNGATLTLSGSGSVTIQCPFIVNNDSKLIITH